MFPWIFRDVARCVLLNLPGLVNIHSLRTGSHGPVEIVDLNIENGDLPMKNGDVSSFVVCLPGRVFRELFHATSMAVDPTI